MKRKRKGEKEGEETPLVHVNRQANILFTREWGRSYVAQGYCVSQATQAEWRYQDTSPPPPLSIVYKTGWFPRIEAEGEDGLYLETYKWCSWIQTAFVTIYKFEGEL
jgi:hypothetical protein